MSNYDDLSQWVPYSRESAVSMKAFKGLGCVRCGSANMTRSVSLYYDGTSQRQFFIQTCLDCLALPDLRFWQEDFLAKILAAQSTAVEKESTD
jgi:hypothetical protein